MADALKESLIRRVELFDQIAAILGMSTNSLMESMAPHFVGRGGKELSVRALTEAKSQKRGYLPDGPRYSYENFCSALDKGMEDYFTKLPRGEATAKTQETVRQNWKEKRGLIQLLIVAAYRVQGNEPLPNIRAALETFRPAIERLGFEARFMRLDRWTAARVVHNFDGYKSVTAKDFLFVASLLTMPDVKRATLYERVSTMPCPTAGDMLKQLAPEELVCWEAIRNKADKDKDPLSTGESWTRFKEKVAARPVHLELVLFLFLDITLPGSEKSRPFTPEDIDLFLMFKYCLTKEAQDEVLEMWA